MFGDFGHSGHRHRFPRDRSPFDSFGRSHSAFSNPEDWSDSHFPPSQSHYHDLPNFSRQTPEMSSSRDGSHVERIIPIQIVGRPSPPRQQQEQNQKSENFEATTTNGSGTPEKKYGTQRHSTVDNLQIKVPDDEKQRAKSEPPLNLAPSEIDMNSGNRPDSTTTGRPSIPLNFSPETKPHDPEFSQMGGRNSKTKEEGGFRNIPIFVEKHNAGHQGSCGSFTKQSGPQQPKMNRFNEGSFEHSTTPPPPPKKVTKDSIQIIEDIVADVQALELEVIALPATTKSAKNYMYLDEMLTRNLIKLDTIETEGKDDVRLARRDCIKLIQKVISILESKTVEPSMCMELVPVNEPLQVSTEIGTGVDSERKDDQGPPSVPPTPPVDVSLTPCSNFTPSNTAEAEVVIRPDPSVSASSVEPVLVVSEIVECGPAVLVETKSTAPIVETITEETAIV